MTWGQMTKRRDGVVVLGIPKRFETLSLFEIPRKLLILTHICKHTKQMMLCFKWLVYSEAWSTIMWYMVKDQSAKCLFSYTIIVVTKSLFWGPKHPVVLGSVCGIWKFESEIPIVHICIIYFWFSTKAWGQNRKVFSRFQKGDVISHSKKKWEDENMWMLVNQWFHCHLQYFSPCKRESAYPKNILSAAMICMES